MSNKEDIIRIIYPNGMKDAIEVNEDNPVDIEIFKLATATERETALALIRATLNFLDDLEENDPDDLLSECGLSYDDDGEQTLIMDDGKEVHFYGCDLG